MKSKQITTMKRNKCGGCIVSSGVVKMQQEQLMSLVTRQTRATNMTLAFVACSAVILYEGLVKIRSSERNRNTNDFIRERGMHAEYEERLKQRKS